MLNLLTISFIIFSALVSYSDIKTRAVPRIAFIMAFLFFIVIKFFFDALGQILQSITGFLAGLLIFILTYFLSKKKLGLADVWYSALIGLVLGLMSWYAAIGIACIVGIIFILISGQHTIPLIPFMATGSILVLFLKEFLKI